MIHWPLSRKIAPIAALFAAYFPIAVYFKHSFVPQAGPSKDMIWLTGPFLPLVAGGKAYLAWLPKLEDLSDSVENRDRSPVILLENDRPLGPAHSEHEAIATLGLGRYSHWKDLGIVFSTSDNSDPNQNWKMYSVKRPDGLPASDLK